MNTESKEHLSSFMDGEHGPEASRFLVRRLSADGDMRDTWARYHLIRDCLRHQDGHIARAGLSGRVSSALSGDSLSGSPALRSGASLSRNWLKPAAGLALAASVALVAVLTVSNVRAPGAAPTGLELSASPAAGPASESFAAPSVGSVIPASQPVNLSGRSPQDQSRMNTYLLQHYQVTGESGGRGFVPFVPIVVTQVPASTVVVVDFDEKDSEPSRQ